MDMAWQYSRQGRIEWERRWRNPELTSPESIIRTIATGCNHPETSLSEVVYQSPFADPTVSNVRRMIRFLRGRTAQDREYALEHLRHMGRPAAVAVPAVVPALISALRCEGLADGQLGTRATSVWVMAGLTLSRMQDLAVPDILRTVQSDWRDERDRNWGWTTTELALTQAIQALAWIGSERIDENLRSQVSSELARVMESLLRDEALESRSIPLVNASIEALGEFGDLGTVPLLQTISSRWGRASSLGGRVSENFTRALLRITERMRQRQ
jgi:hypothetical protein